MKKNKYCSCGDVYDDGDNFPFFYLFGCQRWRNGGSEHGSGPESSGLL